MIEELFCINLSGVIGSSRIRLPVALYTALATAPAMPIKASF